MSAQVLAEELLASARALQLAVDDEDPAALQAALARREAAFARLHEAVGDAPPPPLQALLREVAEADARTLRIARDGLDQLRALRAELAAGRRAAQALAPPPDAPRFVTRRV